MARKIAKGLLFALGAFLVFYLIYQGYMIAYPSYKTEVALVETVSDSIPAVGIVVRDETVIDGSIGEQQVRRFLVNNGDKIAKGSAVAVVYKNGTDALDALALTIYEAEFTFLDNSMETGYSSGTNLETLRKRILQAAAATAAQYSRGDYADNIQLQGTLLELLNSYEYAAGHDTDATYRRDELDTQVQAYRSYHIEPVDTLHSPEEGYFVAATDGYESYQLESVAEMTADSILALTGQETVWSPDQFKVISGYAWQFAAVIDSDYASRLKPGMDLLLDFHYTAVQSLPVRVESVTTEEGAKKSVVVLSCQVMNSAIADLRIENVDISFRNYKGFVIDRSVLRMEEGVVGVYVKFGSLVEFKKVDIVYQNDDYVVSRVNSSDSSYLRLYDEVIVEGKDLFSGKDLR